MRSEDQSPFFRSTSARQNRRQSLLVIAGLATNDVPLLVLRLLSIVCLATLPAIQTGAAEVVGWGATASRPPPDGLSHVVGVAAGDYHALALTGEGNILAWGYI